MKTKLTESQKRRALIEALECARQDFQSIASFINTAQSQRARDLAEQSRDCCQRVIKEVK